MIEFMAAVAMVLSPLSLLGLYMVAAEFRYFINYEDQDIIDEYVRACAKDLELSRANRWLRRRIQAQLFFEWISRR